MSKEQFKLLVDICSVLTVVVVLLSFYRYRIRSVEVKLIGWIFFLSTLSTVYIEITKPVGKAINGPQNIFAMMMFPLLLWIYHIVWKGRYVWATRVGAIVIVTFSVYNILFGQKSYMNSDTLVLGALIVILLSILYLYNLLINLPVQKLSKVPMFWINAGVLTYFGGSLFVFAGYHTFLSYFEEAFHDSTLFIVWSISNLLRIAQFILIIVGLWQDLRNISLRSSLPSAR